MATRRMFNKQITNSDDFLDMPLTSQCLYFHLSMNADDDGFINNWKSIMKLTGAKEDDLKVLIAKQYIIPFDSGVIIIKHWRLNNYLRRDRYTTTNHQKELAQIKGSRGLFVPSRVIGIFTDTTISLGSRLRQCPDHYTIRAGRNLPDKEFRYLRTVIVTAAVYWGFNSMLLLR